jgi:hypothetical protein
MIEHAPLLNLDNLSEFPTVIVHGERYALVPPDALTAIDYHRYGRMAPRLEALWNQDDFTDAEAQEFETILDRLTRIVLKAPAVVHEKLTDVQRLQIVQTFLSLSRPQILLPAPATVKPTEDLTLTGASSPHVSPGSTGETPSSGSLPRPSESSVLA